MILYPHLLKTNVTPNAIWKSLIERLSIGDAPFGTHIHNHTLYYKQSHIELTTATHDKIFDFFEYIVGLNLQYIHFQSWKEIKRKVIKDNLIADYITRMTLEHQLSSPQSKYLTSFIHLYLTLKKIAPTDIHLETASTPLNPYVYTYIKSITGLIFDASLEMGVGFDANAVHQIAPETMEEDDSEERNDEPDLDVLEGDEEVDDDTSDD